MSGQSVGRVGSSPSNGRDLCYFFFKIYNLFVYVCGLQEFYAVLKNYSGQVEDPDPFTAWNVYDTYLCEVSPLRMHCPIRFC